MAVDLVVGGAVVVVSSGSNAVEVVVDWMSGSALRPHEAAIIAITTRIVTICRIGAFKLKTWDGPQARILRRRCSYAEPEDFPTRG